MKPIDFILIIKSNAKYTQKNDWSIIINSIKADKKLTKYFLEAISPLLLKSNITKKDIEILLNQGL
jgi:hypothetical protein